MRLKQLHENAFDFSNALVRRKGLRNLGILVSILCLLWGFLVSKIFRKEFWIQGAYLKTAPAQKGDTNEDIVSQEFAATGFLAQDGC